MIIKATPGDARILSRIGTVTFINAHMDSAPAYEITNYVDRKYNNRAILKELMNPENIYHLIMHQNSVAGFSKMELNSKNSLIPLDNITKIDQIYLLDCFHGLKLGASLLQHNIDYSKSFKQKGMWLVVWTKNEKAIRFYLKFGFKIIEEGNFQLTETHINPCYTMLLQYAEQ